MFAFKLGVLWALFWLVQARSLDVRYGGCDESLRRRFSPLDDLVEFSH